jgi:hypothetical protein
MGDNARGPIFAEWLTTQFAPEQYARVADLAGGKGKVSRELVRHGYKPVVFDCRKASQKGKQYSRRKRNLEKETFKPREFDLIVAMHPDEITWHAIRLASEARTPFVIVPCCIKFPYRKETPEGWHFGMWLNWLKSEGNKMGFEVSQFKLQMHGKNTVLVGRPKSKRPRSLGD